MGAITQYHRLASLWITNLFLTILEAVCVCVCVCVCVSHSVMSDSLRSHDYSPPGSPVHGILQTRILEWIVISYFRGSSRPWDRTWISCTAGRFSTLWASREALYGGWEIQNQGTNRSGVWRGPTFWLIQDHLLAMSSQVEGVRDLPGLLWKGELLTPLIMVPPWSWKSFSWSHRIHG